MENLSVSVSEAVALINQTLEYAFPTLVVEGEVASFKVNQGKWVFFDLKDDESTLGCFMPLFQLRTPLEDGMRVQVVASPKVTVWGKFSLTVREIRPVGEGSLKRAFELLKAKLETEGLFAPERKRSLPALPQSIAVISSTQAAGYADFVRILGERWGGIHADVAHVQVQGAGAADQIIRALKYFNEREQLPELVAIIRGGGSADDLSTFNDELLVRAIAASRVPVVVGVGHEIDETLADLAADVRAATPSHAASMIVPDKHDIIRMLHRDLLRAAGVMEGAIVGMTADVQRLLAEAMKDFENQFARLEDMAKRHKSILGAYNPKKVLEKGYAIVRGEPVIGNIIEIEKATYSMQAEVQHVRQK